MCSVSSKNILVSDEPKHNDELKCPGNPDYDVVVIGSGIGGLSCSALLKMAGKKVLLLDGNDVPGGCMQKYVGRNEKTNETWDWSIGLQYLCPLSTQFGPMYIKELDIIPNLTYPKVKYKELGVDADNPYKFVPFQELNLPEFQKTYGVYSDTVAMREYLKKEFPDHSDFIENFWKDYITQIDKNMIALSAPKLLPPFFAKFLTPFIFAPIKDLMDKNFDEATDILLSIPQGSNMTQEERDAYLLEGKKLRLILASYWNFTGFPLQTNMLLWSIGINQQLHGIKVPIGGGEELVRGFIGYIRREFNDETESGEKKGDVAWGKDYRVSKILTKGIFSKKAYAVTLQNGDTFTTDKIVSAIGIPQTVGVPEKNIQGLLPSKMFPSRIHKSMKDHVSVPSIITLRIGFPAEVNHKFLRDLGIKDIAYRDSRENAWMMDCDPTSKDWDPSMEIMALFPKLLDRTEDISRLSDVMGCKNPLEIVCFLENAKTGWIAELLEDVDTDKILEYLNGTKSQNEKSQKIIDIEEKLNCHAPLDKDDPAEIAEFIKKSVFGNENGLSVADVIRNSVTNVAVPLENAELLRIAELLKVKEPLQTAEVHVLVNYDKFFKSLEGKVCNDATENIKSKLLEYFFSKFPELKKHVNRDSAFLMMPNELYGKIHHEAVSFFGYDSYKMMDYNILPRSGIKNLYLSGMDAFAQGITISAGALTAGVILMDEMPKMLLTQTVSFIKMLPEMILKFFLPPNKRYVLSKDVRDILTKTLDSKTGKRK